MPHGKGLTPPAGPAQALSLPDNCAPAPERNAKLLKNGLITVLEILHVRKVVLVEPEEILFFFLGKYTCGAIYDRGRGTPVDRDLHDFKLDAVGPQKPVCVFCQ